MTRTIQIDHVARVEGHGGVTVTLDGAEVRRVDFDIFEGIRLFEGLLRGRTFDDVPAIVSRVCAICSHNHALTAIQALEGALGVAPSAQTRTLRDLVFQGANVQSHALHVFLLALPDLVGHPSALSLAQADPEAIRLALRLKKLGNTIQDVVGGRAVHPVNYVVGGFGRLPTLDDLLLLRDALSAGLEDCRRAIEFLADVQVPALALEPLRCVAVEPDGRAPFFGETIVHSDGDRFPVAEYRQLTGERVVSQSHAKHSGYAGRSYTVGALARLTLHGGRVTGLAREAWERLGLRLPTENVLMNDVAQVVELIFSVEHALALVSDLLQDGIAPEPPTAVTPHACEGAAATEVPRGTLFHEYALDERGRVTGADVVTPTAQNLASIEDQLRAAARAAPDAPDDVLRRRFEMIVRAYDPCISCSVHLIRLAAGE